MLLVIVKVKYTEQMWRNMLCTIIKCQEELRVVTESADDFKRYYGLLTKGIHIR